MATILETTSTETCGDNTPQVHMPAARIYYFDWLRAIAVLGVIAYHTLLPFARDTWDIANDRQSVGILAIAYVLESFGLGVLFLIAGGSVRFALQRRSMRSFLAERTRRLLVPFAIGAIVLVPLTSYFIGLHRDTVSRSFLSFLLEYPHSLWVNYIAPIGLSPEVLNYAGMHLWFLAWLFICSVLAIPVYTFFSSSTGRSWVNALGRYARWRGAVLLLALPLTALRIILSALPPAASGWSLEAYIWYALIFVVGFILYCDNRLVAAARRDFWPALIIAMLGSFMFLVPSLVWSLLPQTYGSIPFWMGVMGVTGWAWTLAILGLGMRLGFMQRPLPSLASEVALPAYILHFPIVIGISALVVEWPLGFGARVLINALLGVGVSLLVAAAVMQIPVLRPLLGIHRPRSELNAAIMA